MLTGQVENHGSTLHILLCLLGMGANAGPRCENHFCTHSLKFSPHEALPNCNALGMDPHYEYLLDQAMTDGYITLQQVREVELWQPYYWRYLERPH